MYMTELTTRDYKKIMEYYDKPIPRSPRTLKAQAEQLITSKLCRCIKKIDNQFEARSIGACTKTVVNSKGFTRGPFTCKNKGSIQLRKKRNTRKRKK